MVAMRLKCNYSSVYSFKDAALSITSWFLFASNPDVSKIVDKSAQSPKQMSFTTFFNLHWL